MEVNINGNGVTTVLSAAGDRATLVGSQNVAVGYGGDDTLTIEGDDNTIYSGSYRQFDENETLDGGNDVISVSGDRNSVLGSGGDDRITIEGTDNDVFSGAGTDEVLVTGNVNCVQLQGDGTISASGNNNVFMMRGRGVTTVTGNRNLLSSGSALATMRASGTGNGFSGSGLMISDGDDAEFWIESDATIMAESLTSGVIYASESMNAFEFNGSRVSVSSTSEERVTLTIEEGELAAVRGLDTDATIAGLSNATVEFCGTLNADGQEYVLSEWADGFSDGVASINGGAVYGLDDAEVLTLSGAGVYTVNGSELTVTAGARIFGTTDWAGVLMSNVDDNTSVSGTDGNDFIINIGDGVTLDTGLGVDQIEMLGMRVREYVSVGAQTSVRADLFDYGFAATSDAMIFDGELNKLRAKFTGEGVLFSMLNGGSILTQELAEDSVDVNVMIDGALKKVTAIDSLNAVAYDGGAEYYALSAGGTLTGVTGTAAIDDLIITTNGALEVVARRNGLGNNTISEIRGLSAGETLSIADADGSNDIVYAANEAGTAITRTDTGAELWSGAASALATVDLLSIDYQEYYGDRFGAKVSDLLNRYVTVSDGTLTIDMKSFGENVSARITAMRDRLGNNPTVDKVLSEIEAELNDLFGIDMYDVLSDAVTDNLRVRIESTMSAGGDYLGVIQNALMQLPEYVRWQLSFLLNGAGTQTFFDDAAKMLTNDDSQIENLSFGAVLDAMFSTFSARSLIEGVIAEYRSRRLSDISNAGINIVMATSEATTGTGILIGLNDAGLLDASTLGNDANLILGNYGGAETLIGSTANDTLIGGAGDTLIGGGGNDVMVMSDGAGTISASIRSESNVLTEAPFAITEAYFEDAHDRQTVVLDGNATVLGFEVGFNDDAEQKSDVVRVSDLTALGFEIGEDGLTIADGAGRVLLAANDGVILPSVSTTAYSNSRTPQALIDTSILIEDGEGLKRARAYDAAASITLQGAADVHYLSTGASVIDINLISGDDTILGFGADDTIRIDGEYLTTVIGDDAVVSVAGGSVLLLGTADFESVNINWSAVAVDRRDTTIGSYLAEYALHKIDELGYPSLAADMFGAPSYTGTPSLYCSSETWTIQSTDGLTLSGVHYAPSQSSGKWAVLVHGYGDDHGFMLKYVDGYLKNGYDVLTIDQRAAGESQGEWLTMGAAEAADIALWTQEIARRVPSSKITLHGVSMGASTVMLAAARDDCANLMAIVEDCGCASAYRLMSDMVELVTDYESTVMPAMNEAAESLTGYALTAATPLDVIDEVTVASMFVHGTADTLISSTNAESLYAASGAAVKREFLMEGASHARLIDYDSATYIANVFNFLDNNDGSGAVYNYFDKATLVGTGGDDTLLNRGSGVTIVTGGGEDVVTDGDKSYTISGDADGATIIGNTLTGLDVGAELMFDTAGEYWINGDPIDYAAGESYTYTGALHGDTMTIDGGRLTIGRTEYGTVATSDAKTTIDSESFNLTVIPGANTTLKTSAGASVIDYNSSVKSGFVVDGDIDYADGALSLGADNVIDGLTSNSARLYDDNGNSTLAAWTDDAGELDRSLIGSRALLISTVDETTLIGASRDTLDVSRAATTVRFGDGRQTVIGFGDDDAIYFADVDDVKFKFTDTGLKLYDARNSLRLKDVNASTVIACQSDSTSFNTAYIASGEIFSVEAAADRYIGEKLDCGVDFSAIEDDLNIDATTNFRHIRSVTLGGGDSTFRGSGYNESITAGAGITTIIMSRGRDTIANFTALTADGSNEDSADRLIIGGEFSVKASGDDVIVTAYDGRRAILTELAAMDGLLLIDDRQFDLGAILDTGDQELSTLLDIDLDELLIDTTESTTILQFDDDLSLNSAEYKLACETQRLKHKVDFDQSS